MRSKSITVPTIPLVFNIYPSRQHQLAFTMPPQPTLNKPYVEITEQPSSKPTRFRYEHEGRAVPIPGESTTPEIKTCPKIKIVNCTGEIVIVASCVTKDKPYRPHPHKLTSKDGKCSKYGVFSTTMNVSAESNVFEFQNIGLLYVKKDNKDASLQLRREKNIDPFLSKFILLSDSRSRFSFNSFTVTNSWI